jgi:hypothetical protein
VLLFCGTSAIHLLLTLSSCIRTNSLFLHQHYEEIRAKEEERRRKERNREREAAGDGGVGEVEGDVPKMDGKKKGSKVGVEKETKGALKGRGSTGGVSEKVAVREEEEEPEDFEWEEEGVAPMPKASTVEDHRWAETMVRYMRARARMKEEKNALPQSIEQQGMHRCYVPGGGVAVAACLRME